MTLAEFLLARIAEDEATAQATYGGTWSVHYDRHTFSDGSFSEAWGIKTSTPIELPTAWPERTITHDSVVAIGYDRDYSTPEAAIDFEPNAEHIARWDPARVLAECDAKRRIVELYRETLVEIPEDADFLKQVDEIATGRWEALRSAVRLLALPLADHPDYQQEWRP